MNKDINSKLEALTIGMGEVIQRADALMEKFEANKDDIANIITQLNGKISKEEANTRYCLKSPKTKVTVGDNGDFKTINEALSFALKENSIKHYEIILKSGFVLKEQVFLKRTPFYVEINAEDECVNVNIASLLKATNGSGRFFFTVFSTIFILRANIKFNNTECDTSNRFGLISADYMSNIILYGDCDFSSLVTTKKNFIFAEFHRNTNAFLDLKNIKLPKGDCHNELIRVSSSSFVDLRVTSFDKALEECFVLALSGGFVGIPYEINITSNNEKPVFKVLKGGCICASSVIFEDVTNKFNIPENTLTPSGIIFK